MCGSCSNGTMKRKLRLCMYVELLRSFEHIGPRDARNYLSYPTDWIVAVAMRRGFGLTFRTHKAPPGSTIMYPGFGLRKALQSIFPFLLWLSLFHLFHESVLFQCFFSGLFTVFNRVGARAHRNFHLSWHRYIYKQHRVVYICIGINHIHMDIMEKFTSPRLKLHFDTF